MEAVIELPTVTVVARSDESYYARLRSSVRWVETRLGASSYATPDHSSRLLLAKSAAQRAGLQEVGLGWRDVYGIITAETSWVPRTGQSKDGTPNLGIAQFEPATARALGLRNPGDVVESVHIAAEHMKQAAQWSASRIAGLKLAEDDRASQAARWRVDLLQPLQPRPRGVERPKHRATADRDEAAHRQRAHRRAGSGPARWPGAGRAIQPGPTCRWWPGRLCRTCADRRQAKASQHGAANNRENASPYQHEGEAE